MELAQRGNTLLGQEVEIAGNGLYGVMDKVYIGMDRARIVDYKAGLNPEAKIQMLGYAYALRALGVENISVALVQIESGDVLWESRLDDELYQLVDALRRAFMEHLRGRRAGY